MATGIQSSGVFEGVAVRHGRGGGLASTGSLVAGESTHYHAARLPELGDTVLAVRRMFDANTAAARRIELRAFSASAPGRGELALLPEPELLHAPGAIAYARIELAGVDDDADVRRAGRLERCVVSDAAPTAAAARGVAEWLRATWEVELAFGSWPAVKGTLAAFAVDGGAPADWAREWLLDSEHHVDEGAEGRFVKVLSAAWLADAATGDA